jgi:predicted dehydrogenase
MYSTRPVDGKKPGRSHRYTKFADVSWTAEWVRRFVDAVNTDREPDISSRAGWENLAFIDSAYRSLEQRTPIEVPEFKA